MLPQFEESGNDSDIKRMASNLLNITWATAKGLLSPWQKNKLTKLNSKLGVECLLKMWLVERHKFEEETYCNATWDNHYCWPYTPAGTTATRECSEAFRESEPAYATHVSGTASRVCLQNGTWLAGGWTNYTECANSYDNYVAQNEEESRLRVQVRLIVFIGSILSLVCLSTAMIIFCCFRSIWCDRVTIHMHLMAALILRYILLYVMTEAFIFDRNPNYRSEDWTCKSLLTVYLYATVASVNWMLIQGLYLNKILATNVFNKEAPLKLYFIFGWLLPVPLLGIYAGVMEIYHPVYCWKGYGDISEIWIILGPIVAALLVNLVLLANIVRTLATTVQPSCSSSDAQQFQRAAKATLLLSPIFGITNLLFLYNPGGIYHKYYVILNTLFGSTQGIFVSVFYCYISSDVCNAVRRCYRRYFATQQAVQQQHAHSSSINSRLTIEQPVHFYRHRRRLSSSRSSTYSLRDQLSPGFSQQSFHYNGNLEARSLNARDKQTVFTICDSVDL